jgi:hypothetical protein
VTTIDAAGLNDTVVRCVSGEGPDTVLDGFTITGGLGFNGGGIRILNSSPTIIRSLLIANLANNAGGGAFNQGGSPILINNIFLENIAIGEFNGGGGLANGSGSPEIINCAFLKNGSTGLLGGGAIRNSVPGQLLVANCTFIANSSDGPGGAIMNDGNNLFPIITNCCFVDNISAAEGSAIYTDDGGSTPIVTNCIFWDHVGSAFAGEGVANITHSNVQFGWPGAGNINTDPMFVRMPSPGLDGDWGTTDDDFGDLHLMEASPCIDAGDRAAPNLSLLDLDDQPRVQGCFVDMGVFEVPKPDPIVDADTDCDDDVDGVDFAKFAQCFNKAGNPPRTLGCSTWAADQLDFDDDNDVDGVDFAKFAICFNKAGNPPRTNGCTPSRTQHQ